MLAGPAITGPGKNINSWPATKRTPIRNTLQRAIWINTVLNSRHHHRLIFFFLASFEPNKLRPAVKPVNLSVGSWERENMRMGPYYYNYFHFFFLFGPSSIIGIYVWHHPLSRQSAAQHGTTAPGAKSLEGEEPVPSSLIHAGDYYVRILARERVRYHFSKKKKNTHKNYFGKSGNKFGRERKVRKGHHTSNDLNQRDMPCDRLVR